MGTDSTDRVDPWAGDTHTIEQLAQLEEQPAALRPSELQLQVGDPGTTAGYRELAVLGRGGMGEVVLAEDLRIGRMVALKRLRATTAEDAVVRFLREARVQALLDHPAIVPVYELGRDAEGRPYFTMKRLAGRTLHDVLVSGDCTPQQLLRAFVDVCLAIELAHARGVIHRDLKPSNVMIGNYGEIYVLDWGVARIVAEAEDLSASTTDRPLARPTEIGTVLGTPGYMSPEQARGEPVGPPTDVYALGAILFELLAREPLHPRGLAALATTLDPPDCSPGRRRPERVIAPELDEVCVAALSPRPDDRPSVHELADRVQRYLDGDRDLARRRTLAAEQLAVARAALDSGDPGRRADVMRAAGHALALDPESQDAALLVSKLMLEPPPELPAALSTRLRESDRDLGARQHAIAAVAMASLLLFAPFVLWVGVRDWTLFALVFVLIGAGAAQSAVQARRRSLGIAWIILTNIAFVIVLSRIFGPFVVVPGAAAAIAAALASFPALIDRPWLAIGAMSTGVVIPLICEAVGAWSPTWAIVDNQLRSIPDVIGLDPTTGAAFLIASSLALIAIMGLLVRTLSGSRRDLHVRLEIQAWHLEQLLRGAARAGRDAGRRL